MKASIYIGAFFLLTCMGLQAQQSGAVVPASTVTADVVRLASAGVGDEVLLAYVQTIKTPFELTADDVISLKTAKVGSAVIQAMLNHDAGIKNSAPVSSAAPATTQPSVSADPDPSAGTILIAPVPGYYWNPGYDYGYWSGGAWGPRFYHGFHHWRHW